MLFFSSAANGVEGALFFGAGGGFWSTTAAGNAQLALFFTVFAGIALAAAVFFTTRKDYEKLRRQCRRLLKHSDDSKKLKETGGTSSNGDSGRFNQSMDSPDSEDVVSARESLSSEETSPYESTLTFPVVNCQ
ncbi:hypothetical protein LOK49_LG07G00121 [Camellia lanceoleosa]|uniref:Uncharacterized protein n=1 Tax=Camellia lanceoleosa TaxID=1840588 RepID=A0ACC0H783_9ERIC|nr:hypothetical protein LOK49_LG07G00121 [Camellia lanceoleosa]